MPMKKKKNEERPFCDAISRRQFEATTWGDAHIGCSRYGVVLIDGHWACKLHSDPNKRYGWNH